MAKYHILYNVLAMVSFNVTTTTLSYFDKTNPLLTQKYIINQQIHFFILWLFYSQYSHPHISTGALTKKSWNSAI